MTVNDQAIEAEIELQVDGQTRWPVVARAL
jgi:hypothetical protein